MYTVGLSIDRRAVVPALTTLMSLAGTIAAPLRRDVSVRVVSPDISASSSLTIAAVTRRLGFASFDILRCAEPRLPLVHGAYITRTTYLRYAFRPPFVDRPYFLYLDADVLVLDDPGPGFERLSQHQKVGLVRDEINHTVGIGPALPGLVKALPAYAGKPYFNAGLFWVATSSLPWLATRAVRAALTCRQFIHFNDQDALNISLLKDGGVAEVDQRFNRFELGRFREQSDWIDRVVSPKRSLQGSAVIHFVGPQKPWHQTCADLEAVRTYRAQLRRTQRLLDRVGDGGIA